jgi:predicted nucleic acid-binding protein
MKEGSRIEAWIASLNPDDSVVTCPMVKGEVLFGIAKLPTDKRKAELEEAGGWFLAALPCVPVPEEAAGYYAGVKLTR